MAKNPPKDNTRKGSVSNRTQFQHPQTGKWVKRDRTTGQFMDQKATSGPYKGIAKEPDGRQDWRVRHQDSLPAASEPRTKISTGWGPTAKTASQSTPNMSPTSVLPSLRLR